jgi:putative peptidoglycan lipid II flippase
MYSFWTIAVQSVFILRDLLLANYFGTGSDLHMWLLIYIVPGFITAAILGAFPGILVPWISPMAQTTLPSGDELFHFASSISKKVIIALFVAAFLTFFFHPQIELILAAVFIAGLQIFIGYLRALVQSLKNISWVVGSPFVSTTVVCVILFFQSENWGIKALPAGLMIGYSLEAFCLYVIVRKFYGTSQRTSKGDLSAIEKNFWRLVIAGLIMSSTMYIDQISAQWLFGGGIPELTYGGKVSSAIIGLLAGASSVLLFPRLAAMGPAVTMKKYIYKMAALAFVAGFLISGILIFYSHDLIEFLFERGKFQSVDTEVVSAINIFFVCQIPFYLAGMMGVYALQIFNQSKALLRIAVVNTSANFILNIVLGKLLGIQGIALSTAIVYFISMSMIFMSVRKIQGALNE